MGICLCPNSYNIVRKYFLNIKQIYPQKTVEAIVPIDNNSVISTSQKEAEENINSNIQFVDNKNNSQNTFESFQQYEGKNVNIEKNDLEKINNDLNKIQFNNSINNCPDDNGLQINSLQVSSKSNNSIKNIQINSLFVNYKFGNKLHGNLETVYEAKSEMSNSKFESRNNSKNGNSKFSRKVSIK